jgi:ACS family tartrate transporter-like MFS transporter
VLVGRRRRRQWGLTTVRSRAGASLLASTGLQGIPTLSLIAISIGLIAISAAASAFWNLPGAFLTGVAAAGGIALINSLGNLGGFAGPFAIGWIAESHGVVWGLLSITIVTWAAAVGVLFLPFTATPATSASLTTTPAEPV